jgi:hypothetical protein
MRFIRMQTQPTPDPLPSVRHVRRTAAHSLWNGGGPYASFNVCR